MCDADDKGVRYEKEDKMKHADELPKGREGTSARLGRIVGFAQAKEIQGFFKGLGDRQGQECQCLWSMEGGGVCGQWKRGERGLPGESDEAQSR